MTDESLFSLAELLHEGSIHVDREHALMEAFQEQEDIQDYWRADFEARTA